MVVGWWGGGLEGMHSDGVATQDGSDDARASHIGRRLPAEWPANLQGRHKHLAPNRRTQQRTCAQLRQRAGLL